MATTQIPIKYMLYVSDNPETVCESLAEAQEVAKRYMSDNQTLRIESMAAPAPTRIWIYNYETQAWVEQLA